jgi:tetratricopeptide (TPR) repeat protein
VRVLLGSRDRALPDLERFAAEAREPRHRYLARLFEGRAREALDDLPGAAAAYRAATELVPAQSAFLALGRALDRVGDRAEAQMALELVGAASGAEDPWWDYQSGQLRRLDGLLAELRGLVR